MSNLKAYVIGYPVSALLCVTTIFNSTALKFSRYVEKLEDQDKKSIIFYCWREFTGCCWGVFSYWSLLWKLMINFSVMSDDYFCSFRWGCFHWIELNVSNLNKEMDKMWIMKRIETKQCTLQLSCLRLLTLCIQFRNYILYDKINFNV